MSKDWPGTEEEKRIAELIVAKSGGHFVSVRRKKSEEAQAEVLLGVSISYHTIVVRDIIEIINEHTKTAPAPDPTEAIKETLKWYEEKARLARLIHSGGDPGRWALAEDGGKKALAALQLLENKV